MRTELANLRAPDDSSCPAPTRKLITLTGVSRQSLNLSVKRGLLPAPTIISDGTTSVRSRWPIEALDRAELIVERRKHDSLKEIEGLVRARWSDDDEE